MKVLLYPLAATFLMAMTSIPITNGLGPGLVGTLSGVPMPTLLYLSLRFGLSISAIDALIAGILTDSIVYGDILPILNKVYNQLGIEECKGFDHGTGLPLFALLDCFANGDTNADFGGNTLCSVECNSGTCVPYQSIIQAPVSAYPFGCNCPSTSCNAKGPIITVQFPIPGTGVTCRPEPLCNCAVQNPSSPNATGYLCNWVNLKNNMGISLQISADESLSPIRWCTCCG